jgi:hypothetical protein
VYDEATRRYVQARFVTILDIGWYC